MKREKLTFGIDAVPGMNRGRFKAFRTAQHYTIYYPTGCDTAVGDHLCDSCEEVEGAKIRSVGFIKVSKTFLDPSNPVEWAAAIAAKDVIIIPFVNGTFDGGAEVLKDGYGDQSQKLTGYNFTADYKDPNYKHNAAFYNALKRSFGYKFFYRTATQIHITDEAVQVIPKNPVTAATTDDVVWDVTVKWTSTDLPEPHDAPAGIFTECFDYN